MADIRKDDEASLSCFNEQKKRSTILREQKNYSPFFTAQEVAPPSLVAVSPVPVCFVQGGKAEGETSTLFNNP